MVVVRLQVTIGRAQHDGLRPRVGDLQQRPIQRARCGEHQRVAIPAGKLESSYDAAQKSIKGTFTFGSTVWTLDGQSLADGYDYSAPAVQSDVTGSWTMTTLAGETLTFNVSANGTLYGASGNYCAVGGKLEPRVSNKNVYDFSLAFNVSTNCNRSGQGFYGVAVSFNLPNGQRQLIVAGNDGAERGKGLAAVGTR